MNRKEKIKNEIDKTLDQFKNADTLEPNPFLYTRIKQKIDSSKSNKFKLSSVLKPAFFTLLFTINMFTAVWYLNPNENVTISNSNEGLVEIFTDDFNLDNYESDLLIVE